MAKMDILRALDQRNMHHVVERIFFYSNFQSLVQMQYVSRTWHALVRKNDAWRHLLLHDYIHCAKFRKTCDVMRWTPLLLRRQTPQPGQLKYLSFITQYINTKQNLIMQSCAWDEGDTPHKVYVDTEDVRHGMICGDWLLMARGQAITGRCLPSLTAGTSVLTPSPQKLFETEKGGGVICQIATDNEAEPWRRDPKVIVGLEEGSVASHWHSGTVKIRVSMWDFGTGALLRQISLRDSIMVQVQRTMFLSDMFIVLCKDRADVYFKGETRADWGNMTQASVDFAPGTDPFERVIHVTECDSRLLLVTWSSVHHFQRNGHNTFSCLKQENLYNSVDQVFSDPDNLCFYRHLALDFNISASQHYTLRDISRASGSQVIWSSSDPQYTFKLIWSTCYLSESGLTVNFYCGRHPTDRTFVSIPLAELMVAAEGFTTHVREMIEAIAKLDRRPLSHLGVPSKGYFDGANPTGCLVLGRVFNRWEDINNESNDIEIINLKKVQSNLL